MSFLLQWGAGNFCSQPVVDMLVDMKTKESLEESDLTEESKKILSQTVGEDSFCVVIALKAPAEIIEKNAVAPTDEDVKTEFVDLGWKKEGGQFEDPWTRVARIPRVRKKISNQFTIEILVKDDLMSELSLKERVTAKVYNSKVIFPMIDFDRIVGDVELMHCGDIKRG